MFIFHIPGMSCLSQPHIFRLPKQHKIGGIKNEVEVRKETKKNTPTNPAQGTPVSPLAMPACLPQSAKDMLPCLPASPKPFHSRRLRVTKGIKPKKKRRKKRKRYRRVCSRYGQEKIRHPGPRGPWGRSLMVEENKTLGTLNPYFGLLSGSLPWGAKWG